MFLELRKARRNVTPVGQPTLQLLDGIDFLMEKGDAVAIVGQSGAGKSTLLNILGLLDRLDGGQYLVEGRDVATAPDAHLAELRGETFGFVFQQFHLLHRRTALQNVMVPFAFDRRTPLRMRATRARQRLADVGLADRVDADVSSLSGGEQQRVAIARSLVRDPAVILADEPTGSLDIGTAHNVMELLIELHRASALALVIVTHDPGIARLANRQLRLESGRLVSS